MQAGSLEIVMFANIARLQKDMGDAKRVVTDSVATMQKALGAIGAGFSAAVLVGKINSVADGLDKLQESSEKTGASVENLSKLKFFAGVGGSSLDGVTNALVKLSKGMAAVGNESAPTTQALQFLGVSSKDAAGNLKDPSALFGEIAEQLNQYEDGAGKAAIAVALFGKAGAEMLPVLKKMAELGEIEASATKEQAEQAEKYHLELAKLNQQKEILWNTLVGALLPSMESFVKLLLEASKQTGSLGSTTKQLAADGSIESWADKGAMAVAFLADAMMVLPKIASSIVAGFNAIAAGADLASKAAVLTNPIASLARVAAGGNPLKEFNEARTVLGIAIEEDERRFNALLNGEVDATQKAMKRIIDLRRSAAQDSARDAEGSSNPGGGARKKLNFALADPKLAAAELKLYENALQALEQELGKLNGTTQVQRTQYQITEGSLQKLTAAHKQHLLAVAAEIDAAQQQRFLKDYIYDLQKQTDVQQFQLELVGKTAHEQELLNIQYRNEVELKQKLFEEQRRVGPLSLQFIEQMTKASQDATKKQMEAADARREAERTWAVGSKKALDDYIDHATNAAEQANRLFSNAFKNMEDALVDFVMTGKLDFKSLADSIIRDLVRIQIQRSITAPFAEAMNGEGGLFGAFGRLFGGEAGPELLNSYASGTDYVPRTGPYMLHQGEAVVPAGENAGKFDFNISIDARGADAGAVIRLEGALAQFKRDVVPQVADAVRRGGAARAYIRA